MRERVPDTVPDDYKPMIFPLEYVPEEDSVRRLLFQKSDRCFHCGKRMYEDRSEVRFIIPSGYGGTNRAENLKLVCFQCCYDEDKRFWRNQDQGSRFLWLTLFGCICFLFVRWLFS